MIKKTVIILSIISFVFIFCSCETAAELETGIISSAGSSAEIMQEKIPETAEVEKSQEKLPEDTGIGDSDPVQEKLNRIENKYSTDLRNKIETITDLKYRQAILNDDEVLEAINFFNEMGYLDILLDKKISLSEFGFVKLYEILKPYDKGVIADYIKNVTAPENDNAVAFIVSNNVEDIATGFSAFIADSHNIPFIIISYKDGSAYDSGADSTLDQIDEDWKTKGIYPYLSPFIEALNNARANGETESIKLDKTKEEILGYFSELLKLHHYVYFFSNGHEKNSALIIHSPDRTEKITPAELYQSMDGISAVMQGRENIILKRIGNNCGDGFDIELNSYLAESNNILFSLFSSSKGKILNTSPNILDAIAFSMQYLKADPVSTGELKKLGQGDGKTGTYEYNRRLIDTFETGIPEYIMELDSGGPADFEPELRTNTSDRSIFYIRLDYFEGND